jgi:hypothetical protein
MWFLALGQAILQAIEDDKEPLVVPKSFLKDYPP